MGDWTVSEPMIVYYLQCFRDAYWPGGKVAATAAARNEDEKVQTRLLAVETVLNTLPGQ